MFDSIPSCAFFFSGKTHSSSDFADRHPSARVIGTDLSPIQPSLVPPNVEFEVDDCCDDWMYTPNSFDFIHIRGLYGCVADWEKLYSDALRLVAPRALYNLPLARLNHIDT